MMGIEAENARLVLEIVSTGVVCGVSWLTLRIRSVVSDIKLAQADDKAEMAAAQNKTRGELIDGQTKTREELMAHNAALRTELSVHTAIDDQRFGQIDKTLGRIETKIDRNYSARNGAGEPK